MSPHAQLVLLAAAVPLVLAPPAFADDHNPERRSVCPVPHVDIQYDVQTFAVEVSLTASGCASREHRIFTLSALSRLEPDGSRDVADWSTDCGPFRAASDFEDGQAPQYFCNLGVALDHPEQERRPVP